MSAPPRTAEAGASGHGDPGHRGRSASGRRREAARAAVATAARRLLELGGAEATAHTTVWRGGRLAWLEAGAGPPVLLLHGAGGGGANWFEVMAPLARQHRLIAPDLPGFGLSDPTESTGPMSLAALAAVEAVLAAANVQDPLAVCGTSYGALVAFRLAQAEPARVRRLALLDAAGLGREMPRRVRLVALPLLGRVVLARPGERGVRWELRRLVTSTRLAPEREAALVAYITAAARACDRRWFARALRRFTAASGQREILSDDELAAARPPTLVLWGARDRFFPTAHAGRAATLIPRSLLRILPEAGHSPNWERPREVAALLDGFFRG